MAMRCCWPPLNCPGTRCKAVRGSRTRSSSSPMRWEVSALRYSPWILKGSSRNLFHSHVRVERLVGVLEDDLNPAPHLLERSSGRKRPIGEPSSNTSPAEGFSSPSTSRPRVDLPLPVSPTSPKVSPRFTFRSISLTACTSTRRPTAPRRARKVLLTCTVSSSGGVPGGAPGPNPAPAGQIARRPPLRPPPRLWPLRYRRQWDGRLSQRAPSCRRRLAFRCARGQPALSGEVASAQRPAVGHRAEFGHELAADVDAVPTAGVECATARQVAELGWIAFEGVQAGPGGGAGEIHRAQQGSRVGVHRLIENLVGVAVLYDATRVHDEHSGRNPSHYPQVVSDDDQGKATVTLDIAQQVDDLFLGRHVDRCRWLVGDKHFAGGRSGSSRAALAGACRRSAGAGRRRGRPAGSGCRAFSEFTARSVAS